MKKPNRRTFIAAVGALTIVISIFSAPIAGLVELAGNAIATRPNCAGLCEE